MLYPVLAEFIRFPLLGYILNAIYYTLILAAICVSAGLFHQQLARAGYSKDRLRAFLFFMLIMVLPLGLISSRAANMFYHPPRLWSVSFFIAQFVAAPHQTFHAALVLPLLTFVIMARIFRLNVIRVIDTLFLCVPLGHAIGRVGCLLVGCCWGTVVNLSVLGKTYTFHNPVPLYAIVLNLLLFYLLHRQYARIYFANNRSKSRPDNRGMVVSGYLMGYGVIRFVLEIIRDEPIVAWHMTQAQLSTGLFFIIGLILMILIFIKNIRKKLTEECHDASRRPLYALIGFVIYLGVISAAAIFLLAHKVVPWPFHGAETVSGAYGRILVYLPFAVLSLMAVLWVRYAGLPVWENVKWSGLHVSFFAGLAISAGYALFLFMSTDFGLKGCSFVPPALILSFLNAVAEEVLFRLVLFQLLIMATRSVLMANGFQAFFYGIPHLFIGGPAFFLYAVVYGFMLGWIVRKNHSVIPAIICHFVIDIGAVGLPLLIFY